jgi:hypothetical protein
VEGDVKVYIVTWVTESGDRGVSGAWMKEPTKKQLERFMAEECPCDYEEGTLYYSLRQLNVLT